MKFCGNCGQSIPDEARACPYCGTMQTAAPVAAKTSGGFADILKKYKLWFILAGVIAVLAICWFTFGQNLVFGTYETPVENYYDRLNSETLDLEDKFVNMFDGVGKSQLKDIYEIISSSKHFKDFQESEQDNWSDRIDDITDTYGKGWKYTYELKNQEALDADDLKDVRKYIFKDVGDEIIGYGKDLLDLDNEGLKEMADKLGLTKDQLKELANLLKELGQELKKVELSEGYDFEVEWQLKGADDDNDGEWETKIVKIGHNWVDITNISTDILLNYLGGLIED